MSLKIHSELLEDMICKQSIALVLESSFNFSFGLRASDVKSRCVVSGAFLWAHNGTVHLLALARCTHPDKGEQCVPLKIHCFGDRLKNPFHAM